MKLLLIEDETLLLDEMEAYLKEQGYLFEKATHFSEAQEKLHLYRYDAIVLDINLPDGNGLNLLDFINKEQIDSGIIILSARDSLNDKIKGLHLGADDYMTKPFHMEELNARIYALIRRKSFEGENELWQDSLVIQLTSKTVRYKGEEISLTKKEYEK